MRAAMRPHSIFLRKGCALPGHLDPVRETFGDDWMLVEQITARIFDTMIRQAGWRSIWMPGSCARRGFGLTPENATHNAAAKALKAISSRFNAAELGSVHMTKYLGFFLGNVTMHPRDVRPYLSREESRETAHAK